MASKRLPAEERRKQIIRAAIRIFAANGYAGSTTREIAEEAGVAEALLYRYFSGKKDLFVESMRLTAARLVSELERICNEHIDNPAQALTNLLSFYRTMIENYEDFAKMVFVISAELDDDEVRAVYLPFQERTLQVIEDVIHSWQERGLVQDEVPARAAAWVVFGCFHTVALMKHTGKMDELHLDPAIQLVRAIIMREEAA
jgi:AcrR family transcriptional regulator